MQGTHSTYKKLAVKWLNEALCFVSSSVVADSFRLRNRQLLVAAERYLRFIGADGGQKSTKNKKKKPLFDRITKATKYTQQGGKIKTQTTETN